MYTNRHSAYFVDPNDEEQEDCQPDHISSGENEKGLKHDGEQHSKVRAYTLLRSRVLERQAFGQLDPGGWPPIRLHDDPKEWALPRSGPPLRAPTLKKTSGLRSEWTEEEDKDGADGEGEVDLLTDTADNGDTSESGEDARQSLSPEGCELGSLLSFKIRMEPVKAPGVRFTNIHAWF